MIPYNTFWRKSRSAFHRCIGTSSSIVPYYPIQHEEVKRHLLRLLETPQDFSDHGRRCVCHCGRPFAFVSPITITLLRMFTRTIGTTIIRVAYGLDASGEGAAHVYLAERAMNCFNTVFQPGRYLVQMFPSLRHVPAWMPGAHWKREFEAWHPTVRAARDGPWEAAAALRVSPPGSAVLEGAVWRRG